MRKIIALILALAIDLVLFWLVFYVGHIIGFDDWRIYPFSVTMFAIGVDVTLPVVIWLDDSKS